MPTLASLLVQETRAQIETRGLALASAFGLNPAAWSPRDPTRSLYRFVAEGLALLEPVVAGFVKSGFLEHASGVWLELLARHFYGVEKTFATRATAVVTLTNATGGVGEPAPGFFVIEPGDVVTRNAAGKTYTNTSGGTLACGPSTTLDLDFMADEAGSASSTGAGTIVFLVTSMAGVTCTNALAAVGLDDEEDEALRDRCRAKLGTLSACGPRDAYDFVVRDSSLTGVDEITRSRTIADSTTGDVTVYVAGASGAVSGSAVTAAQAAAEEWAVPSCTSVTVANVSTVTVAVTYELWLYDSVDLDSATIEAAVETSLESLFAVRPIGGDVIAPATTGKLYKSLIESTIRAVYPSHAFRVVVTSPSGDTSLAINQAPALGTVTGTIHLEVSP